MYCYRVDKGRFRCKPERSLFFSAIPKSGSLLPEARLSAIFIPVFRCPEPGASFPVLFAFLFISTATAVII
ncbi:hypothetical protein M141_1777 [Bacteroides fragilis str. S38L5]|nr:hypothetical protein M101_1777 [Bacteroides fragilis str. 1007-1-F \